MDRGAWWAAVHGVAKSCSRLSDFTLTFHFHALEKEMATHPSVLAWRIPGTVEPGGLPSTGSHRVRHDWSDLAAAAAAYTYMGFPCGSAGKKTSAYNAGDLSSIPGLVRSPGKGKGYPLQYSGLENSMDSIVHEVAKSLTWLSDFHFTYTYMGFPRGSDSKEFACNAGDLGLIPGSGRSPGEEMTTHSSILTWRIPWIESLAGYSPWDRKELDMTEWLTHTVYTHTYMCVCMCMWIYMYTCVCV